MLPSFLAASGMKGVIDAINKLEQTIRLIGAYLFADNETPAGLVDGTNKIFTLANTPDPASSLRVYLDGMYQAPAGEDYNLSNITITFINAPSVDVILRVYYRYK